ncbi:MAG TPA: FecR family protein [Pyrinomonadaceae bacterium]
MANYLRRSLPVLLVSIVLVCSAVNGFAQNREKFVISAKAGGINAVTGRAKLHLKGGADWQQLMITDDLEAGDVVRTEGGARVEMLLNPGSYLRVGENSEFELVNNSLDNLELKLFRGTAIVEATGTDDTELLINITTPHTKLAIVRHGLYRLNVVPDDATELIVRKGRVMLNDSHTKVKGGNKVIFSATSGVSVAKLDGKDKKKRDDVDQWSKERADALAKANQRISDRMLSSAFASYRSSDWLFSSYRSLGVWFFNPLSRCYTFLPFYYGWGSPYGSSYTMAIYNPFYCRGCGYSYGNSVWSTPSRTGGTTTGGTSSGGNTRTPVVTPEPRIRDVESPGRGMRKPDITPEARRERP